MVSSRFFLTIVRCSACPTFVSAVMPRAVARQVVSESGKVTRAVARPCALVRKNAAQKAVSGNSLRIFGSTSRSGFICAKAFDALSCTSSIRRLPASP